MKLLILDFNKTLYDPAHQQLVPGTLKALAQFAKQAVPMVLVTTEAHDRAQLITKLGLSPYFEQVLFVSHKTVEVFQTLLDGHAVQAHEALIVGDDPEGELLIGTQLHVPTIAVGTGFCDADTAQTMGIGYCSSIATLKEQLL